MRLVQLILSILIVLTLALPVLGADVVLQWDRNTEDNCVGYKIFRGLVSGTASGALEEIGRILQVSEGETPTYTDTNITDDMKVIYSVAAYNSDGQSSDPSNFVFHPVPYQDCPDCESFPSGVLNLRIVGEGSVSIEGNIALIIKQ